MSTNFASAGGNAVPTAAMLFTADPARQVTATAELPWRSMWWQATVMKCGRGALQAQVHGEGHSLGCFLDVGTRACGRWGDDAETLESERFLGPLMLWGSAGTSGLKTDLLASGAIGFLLQSSPCPLKKYVYSV